MRKGCLARTVVILLVVLAVAIGVVLVRRLIQSGDRRQRDDKARAFPVETAPVRRGPLEERRVFSGTLEASARVDVAPKVAGRIIRVAVDIADPVTRDQVVVILDDAEYRQAEARAEADVAVARARHAEANSQLDIARRERDRAQTLFDRGVASASDLDDARAGYFVRESAVQVAEALVRAAESALETARIQLGYTEVQASWTEGDDTRVVAERFVDEGDTVAPNTSLLTVVELRPVQAVFYVPERDYARLAPGQAVDLAADAFPGEGFPAAIHRVAPVFREDSRQARVEVRAENPDQRLKPGMFVRATVTLDQVADAVMVPEASLVRRSDGVGVFLVDEAGPTARWTPVQPGLRDEGWVQLREADLSGRVVTLGQQLLTDGSPLILPGADTGR